MVSQQRTSPCLRIMLDVREPQLLGVGAGRACALFIFRVHPQWTGISNSSAARRHKEINPTETALGEKVGSLHSRRISRKQSGSTETGRIIAAPHSTVSCAVCFSRAPVLRRFSDLPLRSATLVRWLTDLNDAQIRFNDELSSVLTAPLSVAFTCILHLKRSTAPGSFHLLWSDI